nr:reverse transcriptase domain-containing protein [Tanacetum cinerariifolium]
MAKIFLGKYFPPSMVTKLRNEITNFRQRPGESLFKAWECYKLSIDRCPNHNMLPVTQIDTIYNGLTLRHRDTINAAAGETFMKRRHEECYDLIENMTAHYNDWDTSAQSMERETEVTKDTMPPTNNGSTKDVQPSVVQIETHVPNSEPVVAPVVEPVKAPLRNEITNFHQRPDESLFEAWECYKISIDRCPNHNMLPVTQIDTFYNGLTLRHRDTINAATGGTFMKRHPEECYDLNENMIAYHNDWDTSVQRSESSSSITSSSNLKIPPLAKLKTYMRREPIIKVVILTNLKETVICLAIVRTIISDHQGLIRIKTEAIKIRTTKIGIKERIMEMFRGTTKEETNSSKELVMVKTRLQLIKLQEDLKGITTRSGITYQGPPIPATSSPPKVVECETEVTKDTVPPTNNESTKDFQLPPNSKPSIPYRSRLHDQKPRVKSNDQKEKFIQIFQDLNFNTSVAYALILMPKKTRGPLLIPCDFLGMDECLALADLVASINLMPLSVWNKLSLPELSPTCMTLKLADRLISRLVGVAEDVFVKVGTFHFPTDFLVVDFDADPRVSLIIRRSFLKTEHSLIDVYEGELTIRVGNKAITFNLDQTSRHSANYDAMSVNRIDIIDVVYEEYSQEALGFSMSGNLTPSTKPIVSTSSPTLTSFRDSDFFEETDAFLAIDDEPISPEIDESYYDLEGDILLVEEFLNDDPSSPPLPPQELKVVEPKNENSFIDEPPMVELKDLPPHLEYAFLEGDDKLPIIIAKDMKDEEKTALIKVLKSHKQALTWQFSNIKSIDLEFCTHKILVEDDFKQAVQHQRRTILFGLSEDIYAAVDSCETAQEIWLRVQQMMKGSDIGIQEKKAKLFNEWERFTSNEEESIESYYHRFLKLMNDFKRSKHFSEKISSNLKFLNNLQPEWSRHVTIVHQTKDLHIADYTQLYDFLKYNQKEVDELKAERLAKTQDPLALMANSNNPYAFPAPHQDQSSLNQNYLKQSMPNPEDITDPTTAMNMTLTLMAKAFKLNYSTPTNNNQRISSNPRNRQIAQPGNMGPDRKMQMVGGNDGNQFRQYAGQNARNLNGYNAVQNVRNQVAQNPRVHNVVQENGNQNLNGNGNLVAARAEGNTAGQNGNQIRCYNCRGVGHYARNYTVRPRRRDAAYLQTQLLIAQKEEAGIQLQAKEYDLMAAAADLEEVDANCILMANLQ